jgi:hypothetical protein
MNPPNQDGTEGFRPIGAIAQQHVGSLVHD